MRKPKTVKVVEEEYDEDGVLIKRITHTRLREDPHNGFTTQIEVFSEPVEKSAGQMIQAYYNRPRVTWINH